MDLFVENIPEGASPSMRGEVASFVSYFDIHSEIRTIEIGRTGRIILPTLPLTPEEEVELQARLKAAYPEAHRMTVLRGSTVGEHRRKIAICVSYTKPYRPTLWARITGDSVV